MAENHSPQTTTPASLGRHVAFRNRLRKTLYYGKYSDASLPSLPVTDVAVETMNSAVPSTKRVLDKKQAMAVSRRARVTPCTLMMGLLYTERLSHKNPSYLSNMSSSDLFLISIMMASKYLYDEGEEEEVFNDDWAKAGGKCVRDVNALEMDFLDSIDWNLFVGAQEFLTFVNKVESRVAVTHGLDRGWFTYTDLCTLLDNWNFLQTLHALKDEALKVLCLCTAAYVATVGIAVACAMLVPSALQLPAAPHPLPHFTAKSASPIITVNTGCFVPNDSSHRPIHQNDHANSVLYWNKRADSIHAVSFGILERNSTTEQNRMNSVSSLCECQALKKNLSSVSHLFLDMVFCSTLCSQQQLMNNLNDSAPDLSGKPASRTVMQTLKQTPSVCIKHFMPNLYCDATIAA